MAQKRRGGGFRPPELKGTLGTLLRTTLQQAGVVRDVARDALERGARSGRERLDEARAGRRRQDALAELGELVLDLVRRGEIDIAELPEARDVIRHLDEIDADAEGHDDDVATPPIRRRFDTRASAPADGTVSSGATWSPPTRTPRPDAKTRVWRPPGVAAAEEGRDADAPPAGRKPLVPKAPPHPHRKGGISFDDDDLAEYMHPDDVPAKEPPDGDA